MARLIRCWHAILLSLGLLVAQPLASAADPPASGESAKVPPGVELVVDPAPEPIPALKYHLMPPSAMRRPGNAAPIYLRLVHEQNDEWKQRLSDAADWLDLPLDQCPVDDIRTFLDAFHGVTDQLSAAACRTDCNWEYVLENQDPLLIPLPDAQFMRAYARLLAVKARFELSTGDLNGSIGSLQAGMALGQHVTKGPFLVSRLIGKAVSGQMLILIDELVQQPGAPNLYWALAELPRPITSLAPGLETEERLLEMKFPELSDLDRPRSPQDWQRLAQGLREWAREVIKMEQGNKVSQETIKWTGEPPTPQRLADARTYLAGKVRLATSLVQAMSDAEVEVRYTVALHREIIDAWRKWFLVPYPQALTHVPKPSESLLENVRRRELYPLISVLSPLSGLLPAQVRTDRQVARQQAIEALRMHAAATGKLPDTLEEVTVVPVPADPATGGPFHYSRDKEAAVLDVADEPGAERDVLRMPVRVRLRSK
jgi:hypothetical protein